MFNVGLRVIRRLCEEQQPLIWHRAKLSDVLFVGQEKQVFAYVDSHVQKHHALPKIETLVKAYPEVGEFTTPEPPSYYLEMLENKYYYGVLNDANQQSQQVLKADQNANAKALAVLQEAINKITRQKYRARILDVGPEAPPLVLQEYHAALSTEDVAEFGWPYMDTSGFVMPGEVVSTIGRPAAGKTFLKLYNALHNWKAKRNVLFVSMEMAILAMSQRIAAMYAHTNISQLKSGGYSNTGPGGGVYGKFKQGLLQMVKEDAKLYLVDGNLAACAEDVFALADQLKCKIVVIDGAYLLRHKNLRLDRYTRVAENAELIKQYTTDLMGVTLCSWQFSREATKKKDKGETAGLEDIAYSDVVGQISSIVLGLFQAEGVETMKKRAVRVLKGRNGETGQFEINWDFTNMNFDEILPVKKDDAELKKEMKWV